MHLTGTTAGQPVAVWLNGSGKYLARVSVHFVVSEDEARETFARLQADLIGKYGTPTLDKREFDVAGVPAHLEDAAIRLGQARFWAAWERDAYLSKEVMAVEITKGSRCASCTSRRSGRRSPGGGSGWFRAM